MNTGSCFLAGLCASFLLTATVPAEDLAASGLSVSLDNIAQLYNVQSRSISPESFTGEKGSAGMATNGTGKGAARELGQG